MERPSRALLSVGTSLEVKRDEGERDRLGVCLCRGFECKCMYICSYLVSSVCHGREDTYYVKRQLLVNIPID